MCGLEDAARRIEDLRNQQLPAMVIVPAQPLAHDFKRQHTHADTVAGAQDVR